MNSHSSESKLGTVTVDRQRDSCQKCFGWIRHTTVEPVMWLFMISHMMNSVVEQAFFVHKSCRVDHGLSETICSNLSANTTLQTQVQLTVSNFLQWNNIVSFSFPIILAPFFGSWSDRRGRKAALIIALAGRVIYVGMIILNSLMDTWNLNMVVWTASLPMGLLGSNIVIFASSYSYISDVSSIKQLTLRMSILSVVNLSTTPLGITLGSYLYYNVANSSYAIMFGIEGGLILLAVLYSALRLEMRTTAQQRPLERGTNPLLDFFEKKHVVACWNTLTKPRPNNRRVYVWILLLTTGLFTFEKDEVPLSYLYTQLTFSWTVSSFSQLRTFQSSLYFVSMLFGVPLMSKLLGMRDTLIVAVAALSQVAGRILCATAYTPQLFYAGSGITALGPIGVPVLTSMTSKVVHRSEQGKIFAILAVCNNVATLVSGTLYSRLYNATVATSPSSIYWFTCATYTTVILLIMGIHVSLGPRILDSGSEERSDIYELELNQDSLPSETERDNLVAYEEDLCDKAKTATYDMTTC